MNRETWLNEMAALMAPRFAELGHPLPKFSVSVGFPADGRRSNTASECWHKRCSADGETYQIHIRPDRADGLMQTVSDLAHELTHAAVGFEHKHDGEFARVALALGMRRPMTVTTPGPEFEAWAQPFINKLGPFPHPTLRVSVTMPTLPAPIEGDDEPEAAPPSRTSEKPKQSTRMLKCVCKECGYTVRTTAKWLEMGPPGCPVHGAMEVQE